MRQETPSPGLEALLSEIDGLRLSLTADLGAAAGALDAGAPEVARDTLAGAQDDVAVFGVRAARVLHDAAQAVPAELPAPVTALHPRAGRRLAVLTPALTAAAALVAVLLGVVPATGPASPGRPGVTSAAASYAELLRLHEAGAPAPRLAAAARQLHADVARLVALAVDDPTAASQALRLLELEAEVLRAVERGDRLAPELAESQRLLAILRDAVGAGGTVLAGPTTSPLLPAAIRPSSARATDPPVAAERPAESGTPAASATPSPAPLEAPRPQPAPAPPAAPATAEPEPTPPTERPADDRSTGDQPGTQKGNEPEPVPQSSAPAPATSDPSDPSTRFQAQESRSIPLGP